MHWVFGIGAFQTFVFSFLLFFKKGKNQSDKFLMGFFFMISLYLLNIYSTQYQFWMHFPDILFIYSLVFLSYGPLLYFYVLSLTGSLVNKKQILLHSIPVIIVLLILFPFFFANKDQKLLCFTDRFMNLPIYIGIGTFLQYLSSPVYFVLILLHLRKHNIQLKEQYSSVEKLNLDWMRKLLIGGITIWMIECVNVIALNFTEIDFLMTYNTSWYIKLAFMVFVILIGYYGINQGVVFSKVNTPIEHHHENQKTSSDRIDDSENLQKNQLISPELALQYKQSLLKYMEDEKPYMNNELRIQDISNELNIPIHILSYIINTQLNKNFFDFVNAYRIEEAKRRLLSKEYDNLTIIAIAFDCGFNSKATFNRLFKQYTQSTPSEFKKSRKV